MRNRKISQEYAALKEIRAQATPKLTRKKYGRFILDRIVGWLVGTALNMVLASLGVTSLLQAAILHYTNLIPNDPATIALSAGITFIVIFGLLILVRSRRPDLPAPPGDYQIETLKIQMEYRSREDIVYSRSFRIKVSTDSLDCFRDTFHWTGKRVNSMQSSDPHHTIAITDEASFYSQYEVSFNHNYKEGDVVDFTITWELDDSDRVARPFVARQVNRPQKELSFFVKLYPNAYEGMAIGQVSVSSADRAHANQIFLAFDDDGVVSWTIPRPLLGYYYELRWSGPDWISSGNNNKGQS
ncbi:MAG: hypothetical protein AAFW81_12270 [Pseudomonadota bacterium]